MNRLALVLLVAIAGTAVADDLIHPHLCQSDPRVIGPCFTVHGRLSFGNGNPSLRMWRVGTKRYLGVRDDEEPIVPAYLAKCLKPGSGDGFLRTTYGDFVVCPFTSERPGWMQIVCIESAKNLIVQDSTHGPAGWSDAPPRPCSGMNWTLLFPTRSPKKWSEAIGEVAQ